MKINTRPVLELRARYDDSSNARMVTRLCIANAKGYRKKSEERTVDIYELLKEALARKRILEETTQNAR